ncbi:MAG: alpha/beta hydrolase [Bacteroidales bacterium]|nr:alpha/beta hydrolase [Bacteroidales bacterium]
MLFTTYGDSARPSLLLIPGLGVSHEIFLPLIERLKSEFFIVAAGIDGFLPGRESRFTSVDDQAAQTIEYAQNQLDGHIDIAYGLSLGGKILSRVLERNEIVIDHAILDAAPLLPLPRWCVDPIRYYQSFNVWTCYHWTGFWRFVFHSHYFDVLLDECRKVWPSGKGKAVRDGYKDVYTNKLESIHGSDIHYWYGTKESFIAKPQAEHLLKLCPEAHIEVFPGMNHGQFLIDHPDDVAARIDRFIGEPLPEDAYLYGNHRI